MQTCTIRLVCVRSRLGVYFLQRFCRKQIISAFEQPRNFGRQVPCWYTILVCVAYVWSKYWWTSTSSLYFHLRIATVPLSLEQILALHASESCDGKHPKTGEGAFTFKNTLSKEGWDIDGTSVVVQRQIVSWNTVKVKMKCYWWKWNVQLGSLKWICGCVVFNWWLLRQPNRNSLKSIFTESGG